MNEKEVLIEVKDLRKYFQVGRHQVLKAVDGVSFKIYKGETLGLVGESGCGKTTCGKTVMGLYDATGGEVIFDGVEIHSLHKKEKKEFTKRAQIIFQDPYSSLNPRMTVGDIIGEGIDIHKLYTGKERQEKIYELLELVGLNRNMPYVSRTNFREVKGRGSELQERSPLNRNSLSVTSRFPLWMYRSRHRL